jgi:hypothetical protein
VPVGSAVEAFLSANWLTILALVAGIAATVVAYLFGRRVKRPTWSVRTTDLVTKRTGELRGLSVRFNSQEVSDLSVSRIVFFNKGADPIRRADIAPAAPLKIYVQKGATILDASLVAANNPANRVAVRLDSAANQALIDFDYLGSREGAVFDVVHFGGDAAAGVTGIVIGAQGLAYAKTADPDPNGFWIGLIGGLFTMGAAVYLGYVFFQKPADMASTIVMGIVVVGLFALAAFVEVGYSVRLRRNEVPAGLKAFYERRYR